MRRDYPARARPTITRMTLSKPLSSIRLSLLDLVAVREGGTVADALALSLIHI